MRLTRPWVLVILGTLLVVISTALSGYLVQRNSARMETLGNEIAEIEQRIFLSHEFMNQAGTDDALAAILAALAPLYPQHSEARESMHRATVSIRVAALGKRLQAVTGPPLSITGMQGFSDILAIDKNFFAKVEGFTKLREEAEKGDKQAEKKLGELSLYVMSNFGHYLMRLFKKEAEKHQETFALQSSTAIIRQIALGMLILGLILVLAKDLPTTKNIVSRPRP